MQKVQTTLEGERQENKKNPKKKKEEAEEPLDKRTVAARDVLLEQLVAVVEDQHGLHIGRGPDEDLLRYLADGALWLCEKQERARDKNVRIAAGRILTALVRLFHNPNIMPMITARVIYIISGNEWAGAWLAEVVASSHANTSIAGEVLSELSISLLAEAEKSRGKEVTPGAKNPCSFVIKLAELAPAVVLKNIAFLISVNNYDCYPLRSMFADVVGTLLTRKGGTEEGGDRASSDVPLVGLEMRLQLLEILESRILDKSTWTRCRVLHAWAQVSHGHGIPRDRWIGCFKLIIERMSDTSSNVRRTAMATLAGMIDEHPYGDLDIPKNEAWLNSVIVKINALKDAIGDREPTDDEKANLDKHSAARSALDNRLAFARVVEGS